MTDITPPTFVAGSDHDIPVEPALFEWNEIDSNLLSHATRELTAAGYDLTDSEDGPNKWIVENILELLTVFVRQGHSGYSAGYCISVFSQLAKFEPLCPLTGEDNEWNRITEDGDDGTLFQNNRCSHVFKNKNGAYDQDGRVFVTETQGSYTSIDSRVPITFPYTPTTEYVNVPDTPAEE